MIFIKKYLLKINVTHSVFIFFLSSIFQNLLAGVFRTINACINFFNLFKKLVLFLSLQSTVVEFIWFRLINSDLWTLTNIVVDAIPLIILDNLNESFYIVDGIKTISGGLKLECVNFLLDKLGQLQNFKIFYLKSLVLFKYCLLL